jgi:hypothetical protein
MKIFMYVMAAIGVTGVIFGTARFFARGSPSTMTKEYQEATNDYLKVRTHRTLDGCSPVASAHTRTITPKTTILTQSSITGPERRAHHWYLVRGLLRPRPGPEPPRREEIDVQHRGEVWNERNVVEYPVEQTRLFANIERAKEQRAVRESCFLALAVVKTLGGVGKFLYLTHASIYLPLYKDLCRQCSFFIFSSMS